MKPFRALATAAAAAIFMFSCASVCFADDENDPNYVVTTTTGTSAEGQNGVIWTQITQGTPAKQLDESAVNISISVSNIEGGKFTAALDVKTKQKLSQLSGSVGYDKDEFRLLSASLAQGDTGALEDERAEGKYTFKYTNEQGSDKSGEYILFSFETIKETQKDDVLFLTIDAVQDTSSKALSFNKTDGIVSATSSPNISQDIKTLRLAAYARPYTFEELGFDNVINCEMQENQTARYSENGIAAMTPGTVEAKLIKSDYSIQKVRIEVYRAEGEPDTQAEEKNNSKPAAVKPKTSVNIGVPLLLCAALLFASFLVKKNLRMKRRASQRQAGAVRAVYDPRYNSRYPADRYPSQRRGTGNYRR